MKRIVIFASGNGTNAHRIIEYFKENKAVEVSLVLSNNHKAKVLERANTLKTGAISFNRSAFYNSDSILQLLKNIEPDLIVLAGFLWLFPQRILNFFPNKVINIHPALLPEFGGKGMYGSNVHNAVIASGVKESGITIHYVTPEYDKGAIIFQAKTEITSKDTSETVAAKIHELEYEHFPKVIEQVLNPIKNG